MIGMIKDILRFIIFACIIYGLAKVVWDIIINLKGIRKIKRIRNSSNLMPIEATIVDKAVLGDRMNKLVCVELSYEVGQETYTKVVELVNLPLNLNKGDTMTVYYEQGYPKDVIVSDVDEVKSFKNSINMDIAYIICILILGALFIFKFC